MKNRNKLILGVLVVLLGIGLALWPQKKSPQPSAGSASVTNQPPTVAPAQAQSQPAIPPAQPAVAPNAAVGSQRKFAAMGVLEADAILDEIAKQDLPSIFQAMLDAGRLDHDLTKQLAIESTLSGAFRLKTPTAEFLEQLRAFIENSSNSKFERDLVIGSLEEAGTKETVDLLLQIANTSTDQETRQAASALAGVGGLGSEGEKLSPSLERTWRESSDQSLLLSVAASMAKIGTPSSIDLLLTAALSTDRRDNRLAAAQSALREVHLPTAVPPLAARLANQPSTSATAQLVAPILVNIGDVTAATAVVNWLQGLSENAAPLIQDLIVQRTRTEPMLAAWAAALNPAVPFRNEQNREVIRAGLAAH